MTKIPIEHKNIAGKEKRRDKRKHETKQQSKKETANLFSNGYF